MLTIFHVQNVPIIFDWCLCDFLVLKYIDEVYALHVHLSFTDVYIFLCRKCSRISILFLIIYWYWLFFMCKMFLSFSTDVCDFLVLKHIDEVYTLHFHLSLTDVDIFICGKYSNISVVCLIINWCWLFFMCKMFSSFSIDVYVIFLYWNILIKCTHFIFDWCLCDFLILKHINEVYALHLHLSLTDVDIFVYGKYSNISVVCLINNWCWLFFMCKMFSSFSTDVYVIFLYWNILMKCTHFIFICHWLMLTFLFVENILIFQ